MVSDCYWYGNLFTCIKAKINFTSTEGKGSCIKVTFPKGEKPYRKAIHSPKPGSEKVAYAESGVPKNVTPNIAYDATKQKQQQNSDLPKILIVEDNDELREYLRNTLSDDYNIQVCSDGKQALEIVKEYMPNMIISDIMMPGMPGTELCAKIKNNIETCHIPVVLLTALSAPERELEGLRIGADIYVVKPFNMRRLVMQCNNLINTRRLLQNKYAHQLDSKAEKIATNELDQKFIEQATQVVEDNMENPEFSVDAFSREMGVGRTVLFQKIKGITGSTPNNFIMNLRLKKAAYFLLNAPEMNISDIAYRLGFGNPQYFNKCFKELFDIAPTQYRKSHDAPSDPSVK